MRAPRCHASICTQRITRVQNLSPLSTASPMATGLRAVASFVLVFCCYEHFENQNQVQSTPCIMGLLVLAVRMLNGSNLRCFEVNNYLFIVQYRQNVCASFENIYPKLPRLYTPASEECIGSEEAGKLSLSHRGSAWSQN